MSTSVAAPPAIAAAKPAVKWAWLFIAVAVGLVVAFMPTPQGLTHNAQLVLAIVAFAVVLWAAEVMNNGVSSILMMALLIAVAHVPPPRALSGYADPAFWTLLAVLYYGFAMRKTGLAERISYWILSLFPGSYAGILMAFFAIGLVLAMGIPSMTVRTSIMAPIAWALVQTLELKPRSRGSALIMITVVEMAVVPGLAFELGSLNGPVVIKMFGDKHLPLTQGSYFQVMAVPTLILCGLILVINQLLLKPEARLGTSRDFVQSKLKALGSLKRQELITALVIAVSIFLWATQSTPNQTRLHPYPSFVIGMVGLAVFALAGIIRDADIATGISWTLMLFLGRHFRAAKRDSRQQDYGLAGGADAAPRVAIDRHTDSVIGGDRAGDAGLALARSDGVHRPSPGVHAAGRSTGQSRDSAAGPGRPAAIVLGSFLDAVHELLDRHGGRHRGQTSVGPRPALYDCHGVCHRRDYRDDCRCVLLANDWSDVNDVCFRGYLANASGLYGLGQPPVSRCGGAVVSRGAQARFPNV